MTIALIVLIVLCGGLVFLLAWSGIRIEQMQVVIEQEMTKSHADCAALAVAAVSDKTKADALRQAAVDWERVHETADKERLSREYRPGGPSVVNLWLTIRANRIEGIES